MDAMVPAPGRRVGLPATSLPALLFALLLALTVLSAQAIGAARQDDPRQADDIAADIDDLSIEELANIDVTSVSRRPERLQDAPASVFVITADDIRRNGSRNLGVRRQPERRAR